jgi:hypothetical protein
MPEWYLIVGALAALSALAPLWHPMLLILPLFILSVSAPIVQAILGGTRATFLNEPESVAGRFKLKSLTALLHLIQPLARLRGRLRYGLSPWRFRGLRGLSTPLWRTKVIWSERWRDSVRRLESIEAALSAGGAVVFRGGHYDRWDLEVRGGMLGCARLFTVLEEHGAGKQLFRIRSWPRFSLLSLSLILPFAAMALLAVYDHALSVGLILGAITESFILRTFYECAAAAATVVHALKLVEGEEQDRALENNANEDIHPAVSLNPLCQPELVRSLSVSGEPERTRD